MNESSAKPNAWALIPFFVFAAFYVGFSLWAQRLGVEMPFYKVSMPAAFVVASAVSLSLNWKKSLAEKLDLYTFGMGETNIMMMCLIFILAGAFGKVAAGSGAVNAAVTIAQALVSAKLMVAGVFLISCLISLAIGTSCGTIAAVTPIALGFVEPLHLNPALLVGAVVSGAMFGDNLSMISDTTVAATRTQNVRMKDKFRANFMIAVPAAVAALALYAVFGATQGEVGQPAAVTWQHLVLVLPYVLILVLALLGLNVMFLLFAGTLLSATIGLALGKLALFDVMAAGQLTCPGALDLVKEGMLAMSDTLIVAILAGGLFRSVQVNGGISWLTNKIAMFIRGPKTCELGVFALVSAVNCFTANNTVAIVITGPIARECSERFKAIPVRIASVLDTASCVVQGLIPYGAQILIAVGIAGSSVSTFGLLKYLYYQPLLAFAVFVSILVGSKTR